MSDTIFTCKPFHVSREIEVYDYDPDTMQYSDTPIFTTNGCKPNLLAFGFSGDGKTIICPTSECEGRIFSEDNNGVWTQVDVNFVDCSGGVYWPACLQMTTSYDGTRFAIGGGRYTTYDPLLVYKVIVKIF